MEEFKGHIHAQSCKKCWLSEFNTFNDPNWWLQKGVVAQNSDACAKVNEALD
jgi:hypothetical protein